MKILNGFQIYGFLNMPLVKLFKVNNKKDWIIVRLNQIMSELLIFIRGKLETSKIDCGDKI